MRIGHNYYVYDQLNNPCSIGYYKDGQWQTTNTSLGGTCYYIDQCNSNIIIAKNSNISDNITRLSLYYVNNYSATGSLVDYPVSSITVNDGYSTNAILTFFEYTENTATFDASGTMAQYNEVKVKPGNSNGTFGYTKHYFFNDLPRSELNPAFPANDSYTNAEDYYGALKGQSYSTLVYDSSDQPVSSTKNYFKVFSKTLGIKDIGHYSRVTKVVSSINGLETIKTMSYNSNNGLIQELVETNTDNSVRKTTTSYAYSNYTGMENNHMLSQVCQQTIYEQISSIDYPHASTATTYKQWPGGFWAPNKTYQWTETNPADTLNTFYFNSWSSDLSEPGAASKWKRLSKILDIDSNGNVLSTNSASTSSDGLVSTQKYGYNSKLPVASISNAYGNSTALGSECGYIGFESNDETSATFADNDYWSLYSRNDFSKDAYSGLFSRKIMPRSGSDMYGPTRDFQPPTSGQNRKYVISCWVKTDVNNNCVSLRVHDKTGDVNAPVDLPTEIDYAQGTGDWEYLQVVIDMGQTTAEKFLVFIMNESYTYSALVDEFRVHPVDAQMTTVAYDPVTLAVITKVDNNSIANHVRYDHLGRTVASLDYKKRVLSLSDYFYSRDNSATDTFDSDNPNSVTSVASNGGGEFDDFEAENALEKYTEANDVGTATWALDNGMLKSTDVSDGYSIFGNTDNVYSDFVLECDVKYDSDQQWGGFYLRSQDGVLSNGVHVDVNTWRCGLRFHTGCTDVYVDNAKLTYGVWHHVKIIVIGPRYEIWVDGILKVSTECNKYSSGYCGFISPYYKGNVYFDNFTISELPVISTSFSDGLGRSIQAQSRDGDYDIITKTEYNILSKVYKKYKPQKLSNANHGYKTNVTGLCEEFTYSTDGLGRMTQQKHPDNYTVLYSYGTETFTYDTGQSSTFYYEMVTNEDSTVSKTYYDKFGNEIGSVTGVKGVDVSDKIQWASEYDILGNVVKIKPPNYFVAGNTPSDWDTRIVYDTAGRVVSNKSPDEGFKRYVYYDNGEVCYSQNAYQRDYITKGDFTVFKYDNQGRLISISEELDDYNWYMTTANPPSVSNLASYGTDSGELKVENFYDVDYSGSNSPYAVGKLTKVIKYTGTGANDKHETVYEYDNLGRIITKKIKIFNGTTVSEKVIRHTYDHLGRETQTIYPSGNTVVNSYDDFGRLQKVYSTN